MSPCRDRMPGRPAGRTVRRGPGWAALGALAVLVLWGAPARAQPVPPAPPAPAAAAPAAAEAPAGPGAENAKDAEGVPETAPDAPPRYLTAEVVVTELTDDASESHRFAVRKLGNRVRIDPGTSPDPRFTAETLFDYDRRESYRNLADDKITFSYAIEAPELLLALIHGFMTPSPRDAVYRLEVNPDVRFEDHPCTLVLAGFPTPKGRIQALHWVWEARDLDGQAVKVVFPRGDGSMEIVEYRGASGAPFDPALVSAPAGWPVMSGF